MALSRELKSSYFHLILDKSNLCFWKFDIVELLGMIIVSKIPAKNIIFQFLGLDFEFESH